MGISHPRQNQKDSICEACLPRCDTYLENDGSVKYMPQKAHKVRLIPENLEELAPTCTHYDIERVGLRIIEEGPQKNSCRKNN
ncbi:hypothetical protein GOV08_05165 [Candidatus Woesearchaeota archaeon]|nr:hypothetical protein [Candidatus Woesearchaeota archaeon]